MAGCPTPRQWSWLTPAVAPVSSGGAAAPHGPEPTLCTAAALRSPLPLQPLLHQHLLQKGARRHHAAAPPPGGAGARHGVPPDRAPHLSAALPAPRCAALLWRSAEPRPDGPQQAASGAPCLPLRRAALPGVLLRLCTTTRLPVPQPPCTRCTPRLCQRATAWARPPGRCRPPRPPGAPYPGAATLACDTGARSCAITTPAAAAHMFVEPACLPAGVCPLQHMLQRTARLPISN